MRVGRAFALLLGPVLLLSADPASAQLPIQLSFNAGVTVPVRSEADFYDPGLHLGVAAKVPLVPLQLEGSLDRLSGSGTNEDLDIWSAALTVPVTVTPPLSPVGLYGVGGVGLYSARAEESATDVGLTGGAGVRLNLVALEPFAEGRGVLVFSEGNKLTYFTVAVGLRL